MELSKLLESILFWKGEGVSIKRLSEITGKTLEEVEVALNSLEEELTGRGIVLLKKSDEYMLGTSKDSSTVIEGLIKDELHRDLGKAGVETLSIILYLSPVSRSDIDFIRGVNSSFIIRNLLIRGLVERIESEKDKRTFLYKPTFELLSYMGIKKIEELPEYQTLKEELQAKKEEKERIEKEHELREDKED